MAVHRFSVLYTILFGRPYKLAIFDKDWRPPISIPCMSAQQGQQQKKIIVNHFRNGTFNPPAHFYLHKLNFHCSEWVDSEGCLPHVNRPTKSCPPHPAPMMRASLLFDVPASAIVLRRRRLVLECDDLRPIRHEHQLLHRIRVRSLARSRCSHPKVGQKSNYYFIYFP